MTKIIIATALAGFATLKEFLEDECQRTLFALTTKVQPDINYFIV